MILDALPGLVFVGAGSVLIFRARGWRLPSVRLPRVLWPQPELRLEPGLHGVLVGGTGAGKTTLQKWLMSQARGVIVYVTKRIAPGREEPGEWQNTPGYEVVEDARDARDAKVVIRVPVKALRDRAGWKEPGADGWLWTQALELPMRRGGSVALFDEALFTLPSTGAHDGAHELLQQGRSSGVLVIVGSQVANWIDTLALRLAHWVICFQTIDGRDLDALQNARRVDCSVLTTLHLRKPNRKRPSEFAYHDKSMSGWRVFRAVDLARPGWLREKPQRSWWRRKRWLLGLWALSLPAAAVGWTGLVLALCLLVAYLVFRADRALRWRVVVDIGEPNLASVLEFPDQLAPVSQSPARSRVKALR